MLACTLVARRAIRPATRVCVWRPRCYSTQLNLIEAKAPLFDAGLAQSVSPSCRSATSLPHTPLIEPGVQTTVREPARIVEAIVAENLRGWAVNNGRTYTGDLQYIAIAARADARATKCRCKAAERQCPSVYEPRGSTSVRDRVLVTLLALNLPRDVLELPAVITHGCYCDGQGALLTLSRSSRADLMMFTAFVRSSSEMTSGGAKRMLFKQR